MINNRTRNPIAATTEATEGTTDQPSVVIPPTVITPIDTGKFRDQDAALVVRECINPGTHLTSRRPGPPLTSGPLSTPHDSLQSNRQPGSSTTSTGAPNGCQHIAGSIREKGHTGSLLPPTERAYPWS